MVLYCSVPQCRTYATELGVSLHQYPRDKKLREAWVVNLRTGKQLSATSRVCNKHFRDEGFRYCVGAAMFGEQQKAHMETIVRARFPPDNGAYLPQDGKGATLLGYQPNNNAH